MTTTALPLNVRRLLRWLLASVFIGGAVMALAGQWTSPYLWSFALGFSVVFLYATLFVLDDDLARERFRPPSDGADAVALRWIRLSALATFVLAPIDSGRLHLSAAISPLVRIVSLVGSVGSFFFVVRALMTNRFVSP